MLTKDEILRLTSETMATMRRDSEYVRAIRLADDAAYSGGDYDSAANSAVERWDALCSEAYDRITLRHGQQVAEEVLVAINTRLARAGGAI